MPTTINGKSTYRRKGPEVSLHQTYVAIQGAIRHWVDHVRDETNETRFRKSRDLVVKFLKLELRQFEQAIEQMASQEYALDYDLLHRRYVRLTPRRKEKRTARYEAVRVLWKEARARRAAEKELRGAIPRPSDVMMAKLTEAEIARRREKERESVKEKLTARRP